MSDWIGRTLGNYQITGIVGRGGMSTVYRAQQTSIGRDVAIKLIDRAATDADFVARFRREVQIIASLEHIHILPIYDYGQEEGSLYLVMRYLDGGSLAGRIRQKPLDLIEIERLIRQIAEALDYAHGRDVIHRDLKAENVLLDLQGNAYLADFGIARHTAEQHSLTQEGIAVGTPSHMPPEQWQGATVDHRADMYALGVMLYELLTGKLPFVADNVLTLMYKHLHESTPRVTAIRPNLPAAIDSVINGAMAKSPADRFASASILADRLTAALHPASSRSTAPLSESLTHAPIPHPNLAGEDNPTLAPANFAPVTLNLPTGMGTRRRWVLEAFQEWREDNRGQVFFVTGPNGIGKSEIARRCADMVGERVLRYELDGAQARSLDPRVFVESLTLQLSELLAVTELKATQNLLLRAFDDPADGFDSRILEPLFDEEEPIYLLIDRLELAFDHPGKTIVDLLGLALADPPDALRLIIDAAPNARLDRLFADATRIELRPNDDADRADMLATLSTRFATLMPDLGKSAIDLGALHDKAEGNPLYLNTVFDHLVYKQLTPAQLADLPIGLDALYAYLIEPFVHDRPILDVMAVARAPLSNELLAEIFDAPLVTMRERMEGIRPWVSHSDLGWGLDHPALRHWLINQDSAGTTDLASAHTQIVTAFADKHPAQMPVYALLHLTVHFAAAGQPEHARALLLDLNFLEAKLTRAGLGELVADFDFVRSLASDPEARAPLDRVFHTIQNLAARIVAEPENTFGLLYNRLVGDPALAESLAKAREARRGVWLRKDWPLAGGESPVSHLIWRGAAIHKLVTTHMATGVCWLAACDDGSLRLGDGDALVREWSSGTAGIVRACVISPDGSLGMTGSVDGMAHIWRLADAVLLTKLAPSAHRVLGCAISPDNQRALTASDDGLLRLWDLPSGKLLQAFYEHPAAVTCCAFAHDGKKLIAVSGVADGTVWVWDVAANQLIHTLRGHRDAVTTCTADPETPGIMVSAAADGQIHTWNVNSGALVQRLTGHSARVTSLSMGRLNGAPVIVSSSEDRTVRVWHLHTGESLARIEPHTRAITGGTLSGGRILSGSLDGSVRLTELSVTPTLESHSAEVTACAFTADAAWLLTASLDRDLRLWEVESGRTRRVLKGHMGGVGCCAIRTDGRAAISAGTDGTVRLWDLAAGTLQRMLTGHSGAVMACAFSPRPLRTANGQRWLAVSGGADRNLRVWDAEAGALLFTLKGHGDMVTALGFSPDGRWIASLSKDRSLRVWALDSPIAVHTVISEHGAFSALAISPDSRQVLLGSEVGRIQTFDLASGALDDMFDQPLTGRIAQIGFNSDASAFFTAASDGVVRLWDTYTKSATAAYHTPEAPTSGALTPDGTTLAVGDRRGGVTLLRLDTGNVGRRRSRRNVATN